MILALTTGAALIAGGAYCLKKGDTATNPPTPNAVNPALPTQTKTDNTDKGNGTQTTNPTQPATPPVEDKRNRSMYLGNPQMPYDPFYDYTGDPVYGDKESIKFATNSMASFPHDALRLRIVAPFYSVVNTNVPDKSNEGVISSGKFGGIQFLMEIFNPSTFEVPVWRLYIDKIFIGGTEYQAFNTYPLFIRSGEEISHATWITSSAANESKTTAFKQNLKPPYGKTLRDKDYVSQAGSPSQSKAEAKNSSFIAPCSSIYCIITLSSLAKASESGQNVSGTLDYNGGKSEYYSEKINTVKIKFDGITNNGSFICEGIIYKNIEDYQMKKNEDGRGQNPKPVRLTLFEGKRPQTATYNVLDSYTEGREDVLRVSDRPLKDVWADLIAQYEAYYSL